MKALIIAITLAAAASAPAMAMGKLGRDFHGHHPAPGPLIGAGLPVVVLAGGAYWFVRRLRRRV
jgi:hypothetical protein